jgi:hypothetical protein
LLLHRTKNASTFAHEYIKKAAPQIEAAHRRALEAPPSPRLHASGAQLDTRPRERRAELNSWDIFTHVTHMRPTFVPRRVFYGACMFLAHVFFTWFTYRDISPTVVTPILVTTFYPTLLAIATRAMNRPHVRPAARYVFEFLLAFDLYMLATSVLIFIFTTKEAYRLVGCFCCGLCRWIEPEKQDNFRNAPHCSNYKHATCFYA